MKIDTNKYKEILEKELKLVESELGTVAKKNPSQKGEWDPMAGNIDVLESDDNEVADKLEQFEENVGITGDLETRLVEIKNALEKIKNGKFGICEVCGKEIEEKRLKANPAAPTCMKDMK